MSVWSKNGQALHRISWIFLLSLLVDMQLYKLESVIIQNMTGCQWGCGCNPCQDQFQWISCILFSFWKQYTCLHASTLFTQWQLSMLSLYQLLNSSPSPEGSSAWPHSMSALVYLLLLCHKHSVSHSHHPTTLIHLFHMFRPLNITILITTPMYSSSLQPYLKPEHHLAWYAEQQHTSTWSFHLYMS